MFPFTAHALLRQRWLASVLAFAMLVAQAAGVLHKLDFEAHPAGVVCATCVAFGNADTPLPTAVADELPSAVVVADFPVYADARVESARLIARARGPPILA
ncbi:hypothetical protein HPT27_15995 [Permianibacter sp. IMCC34836]|uniref:hypothetical protein n=1 Tax=Permianibacter fluminis TaxID=2738515 RepID=UPI001551972D|nr:hypothetical protein [Permianibacter fluminis]NQD38525.1 hypothetical protein [Permianibacter fluminis]